MKAKSREKNILVIQDYSFVHMKVVGCFMKSCQSCVDVLPTSKLEFYTKLGQRKSPTIWQKMCGVDIELLKTSLKNVVPQGDFFESRISVILVGKLESN